MVQTIIVFKISQKANPIQFYHSASKHGVSPPATPTSHFVRSNKMLDKNALSHKMRFQPIHALSKLACRMQISFLSGTDHALPETARKAPPLKQLKSLPYPGDSLKTCVVHKWLRCFGDS